MPFKLNEVVNEASSAQEKPVKNRRKVSKPPSTEPAPKRQETASQGGDTLPLPFHIQNFVIFRNADGSVSMKQCGSVEAAREHWEKLNNGYVGN